jgi:hypothetical protein
VLQLLRLPAMAATIAGSAGPRNITQQLLAIVELQLATPGGTRSGTGVVATWVVGCQRWGCQGIRSGFEMVQVTRRQSPD